MFQSVPIAIYTNIPPMFIPSQCTMGKEWDISQSDPFAIYTNIPMSIPSQCTTGKEWDISQSVPFTISYTNILMSILSQCIIGKEWDISQSVPLAIYANIPSGQEWDISQSVPFIIVSLRPSRPSVPWRKNGLISQSVPFAMYTSIPMSIPSQCTIGKECDISQSSICYTYKYHVHPIPVGKEWDISQSVPFAIYKVSLCISVYHRERMGHILVRPICCNIYIWVSQCLSLLGISPEWRGYFLAYSSYSAHSSTSKVQNYD